MSPVSDIAKFAVLQVVVISSILLYFDILTLSFAVLFEGVEFSRAVTALATTRGPREMASASVFYALLSGLFHEKFSKLHIWVKEFASLIVLAAICILHHIFYEHLDFKFVMTGTKVADFVILYAGLYLFIRVVLSFGVWVTSRQRPDSD